MPSELKTPLQEQQQRVVDRLKNQHGLVVAHGLGSGKTLASIAAASELGGDNLALVPAALQENYKKEIRKHIKGKAPAEVGSAQRAALRMEKKPTNLLVLDEAHRAREPSTKLHQLIRDYPAAKKMLLTASPVYNRPSDVASLVNMAAGGKILPQGTDFDREYVQKPSNSLLGAWLMGADKSQLRNTEGLKKTLREWVDYHPSAGDDFPSRQDEVVEVPMSKQQSKIHEAARGELPFVLRMRLDAGLPPDKKDLASINQFQSQARQVGGSLSRFTKDESSEISPKLQQAMDNLSERMQKNKRHQAVVYSNYLDSLRDYGAGLEARGIPHAQFTGQMKPADRKKAVDDYNLGKIKALLVSSAGGEGLDLKGTRQVQVLEPHWNEEKLKQVIGRAIRKGSHAHLPEGERDVTVQRYLAHPQAGALGKLFGKKKKGIDNYLYDMAQDKEQLNQQLIDLLK